ncbi:MAG TPA: hypothetical protein VI094_06135 [Propionibacteriaceae bacterium]
MIDRNTLRLSAVLLVVGFSLYVVVGLLHPGGPANNHRAVFAPAARAGPLCISANSLAWP